MGKQRGLALLAVGCLLSVAALSVGVGLGATSKAEVLVEKVVVNPVNLTVSEPSGSGIFTVTLSSQPAATVYIDLVVSNNQCTASPATLSLDAGNWASGATGTATAVDDPIVDGAQDCRVNMGKTRSQDPNFNGLVVRDVRVTVNDDDVAGIALSPDNLTVSEPSGSDIFTLTLTSQPVVSVSISLLPSNNQCSVSPAAVSLDAANWASGATATVSAVDDPVIDGNQTCLIQTGPASSADPNYSGRDPADVTVTVTDDDATGGIAIVVLPTDLTVSEPSGSGLITLKLTSQPTAPVSIGLSASNNQCSVWPATVNLDTGNWASGATATVSAVDDFIADGPQACLIVTGPANSADPNYGGWDPGDVGVTVNDNDVAGIVVAPAGLTVSEPWGSGVITLKLNSQPTAVVSIGLAASNNQCSVSPATVNLGAGNWASGATATVAAVDDFIADGPQACLVVVAPASSADPKYSGWDAGDVGVTVNDDDVAGIVVAPAGLTVSEPSGSGLMTLKLSSQPTAVVSIGLTASNNQCSVSPATVNLGAGSWASGATATVSAVDDFIADGPQACLVVVAPASSADPKYSGWDAGDVGVTVNDDDVAGIVVAPVSLAVSEPSGSGVITLKLNSQPTAPVSIGLSTSNAECAVAPASVELAAANWASGVTATVSAVDDLDADGTQTCLVQIGPASSADLTYDGWNPGDVNVTVYDNDAINRVYLPSVLRSWPPIPGVPTLYPIQNPDGDGGYTISYSSAALADVYVLEEATHRTFSDARQIYLGPLTSYGVSQRGAGRAYYRVKARNIWGDSGWSTTQSADVLWEAEPNNEALTQANGPIASGLTYYGSLASADDGKDYFYFYLPSAGIVQLWLSNIPTGQNYDLVLRDDSLTPVGYSARLGNADEYILGPILPAGRYYIHVHRSSQGGNSQPYHLKVEYQE